MAKRAHLWAAAGYAALTVVVLWPAVASFSSEATVGAADGSVFRWIWWEMPRALREGRNPFATDAIFHPVGADLALTTSAPLVGLLTWPLQVTAGSAAQVNAVQLTAMFLAGFGAYLLALRVCREPRAAFLAGVAYALLPHRFVHVEEGHLNLVHSGMIPLALLALLRVLERPEPSRALVLGGVVGATFLVDPQLVMLTAFAAVPLCVVQRRALRAAMRSLLLGMLIALVVALPLLVPMMTAVANGEGGGRAPADHALIYSASPLSWVVPPFERLWIGHLASPEPLTPTDEGVVFPGLVVIALAFAGWRSERDARRGWAAVALLGIVLSLGPYLFVRDTYIELPLPFFAVNAIPGLDMFRVPGRFALIGALGLVVLAALGMASFARRHPRRVNTAVALACLLTAVELWPRSLPSSPADVPRPYHAISDASGDGAVLEIPIQWSTGQDAIGFDGDRSQDFLFLVNAIEHGRPTVSGAVSRLSADRFEQLRGVDLYRQVLSLQHEEGFDETATFEARDLLDAGIDFVAYDRTEPVPRAFRYLKALDLPVLADDGRVIVWAVDG